MDTPVAYMTVAEAAKATGCHENTIRKRIKTGKYSVEWTDSPHGKIQLIPRDQVLDGVEPPHDVNSNNAQIDFIERPAQPDLHQVLATFVNQLQETASENGRLKAELAHALAEIERLKVEADKPVLLMLETKTSWWDKLKR